MTVLMNGFMPGDPLEECHLNLPNNFGMKLKFLKYLKGSSRSSSDEQLSL